MTAARRQPAPVEAPPFDPTTEDDRDLRWFFEQGPKPKKRTRPEKDRHERIAYALNGRGHALRIFYTRSRTEWTAWDAATLDPAAARALCFEYKAYAAVAHRRGRPVPLEPHVVVATDFVIASITELRPPEHGWVNLPDGRLDKRLETAERAEVVMLDVAELLEDKTIEPGTWDRTIRVSGRGARYLLRVRALVEIRNAADRAQRIDEISVLKDEAAVDEIRKRFAGGRWLIDLWMARYVESEAAANEREFATERAVAIQNALAGEYDEDEPEPEDAREAELARLWRTADAKVPRDKDQIAAERAAERDELKAVEAEFGFRRGSMSVETEWRSREQRVGRDYTTVDELDRKYKVGVRFLRAQLARCGRSTTKRAKIPNAWFGTPEGEKFRAAVAAEYPLARARRKAKKKAEAQKRQWVKD